MKPYPHPPHVISEVIKSPKSPVSGQKVDFQQRGAKGKELSLRLELTDGPFMDIQLRITAGDIQVVESYRAALTVDGPRVRGVDHSTEKRTKFYKVHIPKGWHQNLIDPSLTPTVQEENRHEPLPDFSPHDLQDFLRKICRLWNINLDFNEELL